MLKVTLNPQCSKIKEPSEYLVVVFSGVIIVYDITKSQTFLNCARWLDDVKKYAAPTIAQILIGKTDIHVSTLDLYIPLNVTVISKLIPV